MRFSYLIPLLISCVLFSFDTYAQSKTKIDMIGEYHYFYGNNTIKIKILDSLIACNKGEECYVIAIEFPVILEYFISFNDTVGIKKYFQYNTDKKLCKSTPSKINQISLNFVNTLVKYKKNANIIIRCIDTYYTNRSVIFTIYRILEKYSVLHDSFFYQIGLIMQKDSIESEGVWVVDTLKMRLSEEYYPYEKLMDSTDFYYLKEIVSTPFYTFEDVFDYSRDEYMYNKINRLNIESKRVICFNGNAHVRKGKDNLYKLLSENNSYDVFSIGILLKHMANRQAKLKFDRVFINEGSCVF